MQIGKFDWEGSASHEITPTKAIETDSSFWDQDTWYEIIYDTVCPACNHQFEASSFNHPDGLCHQCYNRKLGLK